MYICTYYIYINISQILDVKMVLYCMMLVVEDVPVNMADCKCVRKNLDMNDLERFHYIRTVKLASTVEPFKSEYDQLISIHEELFFVGIHDVDFFLPWHCYLWKHFVEKWLSYNCALLGTGAWILTAHGHQMCGMMIFVDTLVLVVMEQETTVVYPQDICLSRMDGNTFCRKCLLTSKVPGFSSRLYCSSRCFGCHNW